MEVTVLLNAITSIIDVTEHVSATMLLAVVVPMLVFALRHLSRAPSVLR